jgi:hypothetical protein
MVIFASSTLIDRRMLGVSRQRTEQWLFPLCHSVWQDYQRGTNLALGVIAKAYKFAYGRVESEALGVRLTR